MSGCRGRLAYVVAWPTGLRPLAVELGLDAVHAWLLGLTRADLAHVLSSFSRLRTPEQAEHGCFFIQECVLAAFDVLGLDAAA